MKEIFDVIVVGGGASGMFCAGTAGARGARVLLLEKNDELGKKILVTGHGRCNLTQAEFNIHKLVKAYGKNGSFLFSSLHRFGPKEIMNFFEGLGVDLKTEDKGRVFPARNNAEEVIDVLKKFMVCNGVKIEYNITVKDIKLEKNKSWKIMTDDSKEYISKNVVIASGGLSYPALGTTGDGYKFGKKLGHEIVSPIPALVPLLTKETWVKNLQGVSLKGIEVRVVHNNKCLSKNIGDLLFTHFGVSGPVVLNISKEINEALQDGEVNLVLNLFPTLDEKKLDNLLVERLTKSGKKSVKNVLNSVLPEKLVLVILELAEIKADKLVGDIRKEDRTKLRNILQNLELTITGNLGFDLAMVTSGGINLKEIDPKTMASKIHNNLYFIGEVLDIDGPTGGYNLTMSWSTGHLAGESVNF